MPRRPRSCIVAVGPIHSLSYQLAHCCVRGTPLCYHDHQRRSDESFEDYMRREDLSWADIEATRVDK